MAAENIDFIGYDNEDIDRQFTLLAAPLTTPYDLTYCEFELEIRDQKSELVLRLTSVGGEIIKTDPVNGVFTIHIPHGAIAFDQKRSMKYDLILRAGSGVRRLWGGSVKILAGVTVVT